MRDIDFDGKEIELHPLDTDPEMSIHTKYILARWCYLMGEPYLSDIEYDKIERQFWELYPEDIHSKQPWSFDQCPEEILKKYNRTSLICNPVMGYMAESIYSINNWDELKKVLGRLSKRSRVSFKIDGWNTRVSYFNGHIVNVQTRGRQGNNLDIRNVAELFPKTIPIRGRVAITGEMSIPNAMWPMFKDITGNSDQRASVRTALARNDVKYLSFLAFNIFIENSESNFDQYERLKELGFTTPRFMFIEDYNGLLKVMHYMSGLSKGYGYLTDGLVIENEDIQYAIRLEAWEERNMHSYVTGYEENQGAYGTFFKVLCNPVINEGKTFTKISINNIAQIIENRLEIGSPIVFNLRSAANVVIDVGATRHLQNEWRGRYEEYKEYLKRSTR